MSDPLISIVIPAYKAERFIGETLASIKAQTFPDWEAIVVEDGTKDGTEALVKAFAASVTQPVIFLRHEVNQGLPATRNTAIAAARGAWIALLDSDDLWTPDHLEKAIAVAKETGADLVHSGVMMFDSDTGREEGVRIPTAEAISRLPLSLFAGKYTVQPSSALIRCELCRNVGGFDPKCRYVEDREMWMRLIRAGAKIGLVKFVTCRYRQHATAMTKNALAMAEGVAYVYSKNTDWEAIPKTMRRSLTSEAWLSAARLALHSNPNLARQHAAKALRQRPFSPRLLAYFFFAFSRAIIKGGAQ